MSLTFSLILLTVFIRTYKLIEWCYPIDGLFLCCPWFLRESTKSFPNPVWSHVLLSQWIFCIDFYEYFLKIPFIFTIQFFSTLLSFSLEKNSVCPSTDHKFREHIKIEPCHSFVVKAVFQLMDQIVFLGILLTWKEIFGIYCCIWFWI